MQKNRSECPIGYSLDIFGDRWTMLILRDIMLREKVSYSEFLESEEKIATNVLANRLSLLEEEKILIKEVSEKNKSKFVYSLSQKGADLLPILIEILAWGLKYSPKYPKKELGERIKKDKTAVLKELTRELNKKVK